MTTKWSYLVSEEHYQITLGNALYFTLRSDQITFDGVLSLVKSLNQLRLGVRA